MALFSDEVAVFHRPWGHISGKVGASSPSMWYFPTGKYNNQMGQIVTRRKK
jgi:hypothetical protein